MNKSVHLNTSHASDRQNARDRMRQIAAETVEIAKRGFYVYRGETIEISEAQRRSENDSLLITPSGGADIIEQTPKLERSRTDYRVVNESAVKTVHDLVL